MLTSLLLCGCSGYGGVLIPEREEGEREGRGRDRNIVRKMGEGRGEEERGSLLSCTCIMEGEVAVCLV